MKYLKLYEKYISPLESFIDDPIKFTDNMSSSDFTDFILLCINNYDIDEMIPILQFKGEGLVDVNHLIYEYIEFGFKETDEEFDFILELCNLTEKEFTMIRQKNYIKSISYDVSLLKDFIIDSLIANIEYIDGEFKEVEKNIKGLERYDDIEQYFNQLVDNEYLDNWFFYHHTSETRIDWEKRYNKILRKKNAKNFNL